MICRNCKFEHPALMLCSQAARIRASNVVVNKPVVVNVVVNRKKDRHKRTPERLAYIRQKMREYRERKRAA